MCLDEYRNIYFVGVGGIGMSALARYFKYNDYNVGGYDKTTTPLTLQLDKEGINIQYIDNQNQIPFDFLDKKKTLVVYTPAVGEDCEILSFFKKEGFTLQKRAQVIGEISKNCTTLAIAGTHGKTTTSTILTHILYTAKQKFTAFIGGISNNYKSNFVYTGSEYLVVEADEFDRSFLELYPEYSIITTTDADHLDIYKDVKSFEQGFQNFVSQSKYTIKHSDINNIKYTDANYGCETSDNDYNAFNIDIRDGLVVFDLKTPTGTITNLETTLLGKHNLNNCIAAIVLAQQIGVIQDHIREALKTFKGIERRFSVEIHHKEFTYIDDYAHHPTEIQAVADTLEQWYPSRKATVIFQPHLYSRTRDFGSEFAVSLSRFDTVLLLDIYPAREVPIPNINADWLLEKISSPNKYKIDKQSVFEKIEQQSNTIVLTLGAGDIGLLVPEIKNKLQQKLCKNTAN